MWFLFKLILCVFLLFLFMQEGGNSAQPRTARARPAEEAETHPHRRSTVLNGGPKKSQVSIC